MPPSQLSYHHVLFLSMTRVKSAQIAMLRDLLYIYCMGTMMAHGRGKLMLRYGITRCSKMRHWLGSGSLFGTMRTYR